MTVPAIDQKAIAEAVRILDAGGLVAMPTETVYGLAADADNEEAVLNTYRAKGRPTDHPLIVHVASAEDIPWWAESTPEAEALARRYWPGPLTLVLKKKPRCGLWVTGGQDTVALRCPSHPWAHALLKAFGGPKHRGLTAPSANSFGRISPSCARHVADDLGVKPAGKLDMILDGGTCEYGIESTMLPPDAPRSCATASSRAKCSRKRSATKCPTPEKMRPGLQGASRATMRRKPRQSFSPRKRSFLGQKRFLPRDSVSPSSLPNA